MKEIVMQFPNVQGSSLYNGRGHFIVPVDVVKLGNTNVYVFEYDDLSLKKRSRALVQKTVRGLSHIPLMNKTGLNNLFQDNLKGRVELSKFLNGVTNIGVTKMYTNIDKFLDVLDRERIALLNNTQESVMAVVNGRKQVLSGINIPDVIVHEELSSKYTQNRKAAAIAEANAPKEEHVSQATEVDRGELGFFGGGPAAFGPGRQSGFGRPLMYAGGMRPGMPGPGGMPPMGPMNGPIPPREGPIDEGPIEEGPIEEAPHGPRM